MKAEILSVGTEILLGDIVNTNSQYLSKRLADLGISVFHQSVVGDNEDRLYNAYELAFKRADIVIATGGLGPTKDDLTKEIGAKYFRKKLILHEESLNQIKEFFHRLNREMGESNKKQAYIPEGAVVLPNSNGTAPGCIIAEDNKILVMLPGPPKEMIPMFENCVVPYLLKFSDGVLVSKVLRVAGLGESAMAEKVQDIMDSLRNPTVAPYAKDHEAILRITAKGNTKEEAESLISPIEIEIRKRLGENIYGEGETTLETVVGEMLVNKKLTIATAESCTGGLLAGTLINYPGISSVFVEGAVTYSNEAKIKRLNVKKETLEKYGAVSEETAKEMAEGIAKAAGTDIGISVTGIAGPGGGTKEKPVGLVYAGLYIKGEVKVKKLNLSGDRQKIRYRTVISLLDWLRRELIGRI
ncbi:competence/damage-inducible protein A [Clostridium sp. SYSU_GA19001]|uniref:competence/damage-inducible protein A n=1 Tax=Clostridium caldaquaticum TaxID=2940653 RepID=UPI002076F7D1|nr:competence/damage-inducible protein A [Clostridium caldaquaticum]MCM8711779.1 competence/damage-inducible protein A [Clostridium caldaquaticum]